MSGYQSGLVTPEAVVLQIRRAGPGVRILARGLDTVIQFVLLILFLLGLTAIAGGSLGTAGVVIVLIAIPLIVLGYPAILETLWHGRTVGKAAFGLRVVTKEGAPIRFRHAAIRSVLYIFDGLLVGPVVGILMMLITRDTVRLGDIVAGTMVVRERGGAPMPISMAFGVPPGWEDYVATLDVGGLSSADYEVVRAFLIRAPSLGHESRWSLSVQIADSIARRIRHTVPAGVHPEAFLNCVAAAFQQRFPMTSPPGQWRPTPRPASAPDSLPETGAVPAPPDDPEAFAPPQ